MTRTVTSLAVTEKNVGSGNWDATRLPIDRVIIHTMVGSAASAASRFYATNSGVSAHYGVLKNGDIWHWVDEDNTAYHAGNYDMNQRSIGIEHEDNGMVDGVYDDGPRPDALYTSSAKLVRDICQFYNIPIDRQHILKHSEVSDKPTACCDALDIDRIVREAAGETDNILKSRADAFIAVCTELGCDANKDVAIAKIRGLKEENTHLTDSNQAKDRQHEADAMQITDLQKQIEVQKQQVEVAQHVQALLKQDIDELKTTNDAQSKEITRLRSSYEALEGKVKDLQESQPVTFTGWRLSAFNVIKYIESLYQKEAV